MEQLSVNSTMGLEPAIVWQDILVVQVLNYVKNVTILAPLVALLQAIATLVQQEKTEILTPPALVWINSMMMEQFYVNPATTLAKLAPHRPPVRHATQPLIVLRTSLLIFVIVILPFMTMVRPKVASPVLQSAPPALTQPDALHVILSFK